MSYIDDAVKNTAEFEGAIPHLYLDDKGNVTVGIGRLIPNLAAALAKPFFISPDGVKRPATHGEIAADYDRLRKMPAGMKASAYRWTFSVWVTADWMESDLALEMQQIDATLAKTFPRSYAEWPDAAKVALLDMAFNLGLTKLLGKYPKMMAAVSAGNWHLAAEESARDKNDPGFEHRNQWTAQMFSTAARTTQVIA